MNAKERGFLLLTSALGDPERKPLTVPQFRTLASRVRSMDKPKESRELTENDLVALGYDRKMALRITELLLDEGALARYLHRGKIKDCFPLSRVSEEYPLAVRKRLGLDAPGCLWTKGDRDLLQTPLVALVGSRDLAEPNRVFAEAVGREAARQGITLISGNARGADRTAQEACLAEGGRVICVIADALQNYPLRKNILYLSEDSFDLPFSPQRALSRNRVIHSLGAMTLVAQCTLGTGGTWDGTLKNLHNNWSPVFVYVDGSVAAEKLVQMGATAVVAEQLSDITSLCAEIQPLI